MRNAENDREIIAETKGLLDIYGAFIETSDYMLLVELQDHWLERAVAAEQRVAELEEFMRLIIGTTKPPYSPWHSAVGHADAIDFAQSALKGANE